MRCSVPYTMPAQSTQRNGGCQGEGCRSRTGWSWALHGAGPSAAGLGCHTRAISGKTGLSRSVTLERSPNGVQDALHVDAWDMQMHNPIPCQVFTAKGGLWSTGGVATVLGETVWVLAVKAHPDELIRVACRDQVLECRLWQGCRKHCCVRPVLCL